MTKYNNLSITLVTKYTNELSPFNVSKIEETYPDGKIMGEFYFYSPEEMNLEVNWDHYKLPENFQNDFEKKHSISV